MFKKADPDKNRNPKNEYAKDSIILIQHSITLATC